MPVTERPVHCLVYTRPLSWWMSKESLVLQDGNLDMTYQQKAVDLPRKGFGSISGSVVSLT